MTTFEEVLQQHEDASISELRNMLRIRVDVILVNSDTSREYADRMAYVASSLKILAVRYADYGKKIKKENDTMTTLETVRRQDESIALAHLGQSAVERNMMPSTSVVMATHEMREFAEHCDHVCNELQTLFLQYKHNAKTMRAEAAKYKKPAKQARIIDIEQALASLDTEIKHKDATLCKIFAECPRTIAGIDARAPQILSLTDELVGMLVEERKLTAELKELRKL